MTVFLFRKAERWVERPILQIKQHGLPPSLKLCRDKKAHPTQETRVKKVELPPGMADIVIVDS